MPARVSRSGGAASRVCQVFVLAVVVLMADSSMPFGGGPEVQPSPPQGRGPTCPAARCHTTASRALAREVPKVTWRGSDGRGDRPGGAGAVAARAIVVVVAPTPSHLRYLARQGSGCGCMTAGGRTGRPAALRRCRLHLRATSERHRGARHEHHHREDERLADPRRRPAGP